VWEGRSRGAPLSRLTGVGWSGSASPGPTAGQRQVGAAPLPHCADMLSALENSDSRKVRPCQKSCNKPLHRHTTDRGAPCALYPAIKRSTSPASSAVRHSSTNCDEKRPRKAWQEQISCSRHADSSVTARIPEGLIPASGAAAVARVVRSSGARRRQAGLSQRDVRTSGIVDSGQ
jgi:hypothetical protein